MQIPHSERLRDVIRDAYMRTHRYIERESETEMGDKHMHTYRYIRKRMYAVVDAFIWSGIYGGWKRRRERRG